MQYKDFHGKNISRLGLGALRFPTEPGNPERFIREEGQKVLDAALKGGINYIDTAYSYQNGDSERFLGEALQKYPRDSYYLATKFSLSVITDIEAAFEEQLQRLQTEYFDFYLLHWLHEGSVDAYTDKEKDYIGFIRKQKELGRIRHIGFSSHAAPETLKRFLDYFDGYDMALIQLNYLDWTLLDAKRQYEILTEHNIPIWVMEPLKGGRLADLGEEANAILKAVAPNRSISSWGLRWLMGLSNVHTVLSGMSSVEQVQDNVYTFSEYDPLSATEQKALDEAIAVLMRKAGVPCSGCRYCCATCPADLDIPLLIKGYNEMKISNGSLWKVEGLRSAKKATECLQCGECAAHCPQKIDIPSIMQEIAQVQAKDPKLGRRY